MLRWLVLRNSLALSREFPIAQRTILNWTKRPEWIAAAEEYDRSVGARALAQAQSIYLAGIQALRLRDEYEVEDTAQLISLLGKLGAQIPKPATQVEAAVTLHDAPDAASRVRERLGIE